VLCLQSVTLQIRGAGLWSVADPTECSPGGFQHLCRSLAAALHNMQGE
jgi:hypothetical protein